MNKQDHERYQTRMLADVYADDYTSPNLDEIITPEQYATYKQSIAQGHWQYAANLLAGIMYNLTNDDDIYAVYNYWYYAELRAYKLQTDAINSQWQNKI